MKRILFLAVIGTAFLSQTVQGQVFNDHSRVGGVADLTKTHSAWTTTSGAGSTTGAVQTITLTDLAAINPGSIVDISLAIRGLTIANANDLTVTLSHNGGTPLTLADGSVLTNVPIGVGGGASQHSYSDVDVTFRNASSQYGEEGIDVGPGTGTGSSATNFSFVGVDNSDTGLDQLDIFDGLDPNATWTVAISTTNTTPASWTDITLGGFSEVVVAVPEPASMSLFALGMLGLGTYRRRRKSDESEDA